MQTIVLAGGLGSRLAEETDLIPKPMIRLGRLPILHHIMNYYSSFGHNSFIVALGYKGEVIKDYFEAQAKTTIPKHWTIKLVDTGPDTSTGGRIKLLRKYLDKEFMLTYGDGLANVNIDKLIIHHRKFDKIATVTAVRPPARFGSIQFDRAGLVKQFSEKNPQDVGWINGGFFCMKREICSHISDLETSLESAPMTRLVESKQLAAYKHFGWWQPMDTIRDKRILEQLWHSGAAPWLR